MDVASEHTQKLLRDQRQQSQDRSQLMYLQRYRATATTVLRVEAGALTLRAAFSHIPFWRAATSAVQRVVLAPVAPSAPASRVASPVAAAAELAASELAAGSSLPRASSEMALLAAAASAAAPNGSVAGGDAAGDAASHAAPFRPSSLQIHLGVQQATAVLCNDKPETFGAPDVLQASLANVVLAYDTATLLPDRPANKAGEQSSVGRQTRTSQ